MGSGCLINAHRQKHEPPKTHGAEGIIAPNSTTAENPAGKSPQLGIKDEQHLQTREFTYWMLKRMRGVSVSSRKSVCSPPCCWPLWMIAVVCFSLSAILAEASRPPRPHPVKIVTNKGINPDEFLHHFGYLPEDHEFWRHFRDSRKEAVSLYQQLNGLNVTGKLNKQTWRLMRQPRCGNPDVGSDHLPEVTSGNGSHVGRRVKRYAAKKAKQMNMYDYKWLQRQITWRPTRFFTKLSVYTQWRTLKKAFDTWSKPSQLTVNYDPLNPDIRVSFWSREHGDGNGNAFDGKGKLLAHAFPPGDVDLAGDIHFDADEPWSVGVDSKDTKDLLMIAMHEAGHAVGLSHSMKEKDIMYPVYGSFKPDPSLSRHDVRRLQRLYGRNPAYKWTPPPSLSERKHRRRVKMSRVSPRWCRMHFNDVIRGPYGRGYIFSKSYVYRFNHKGVVAGYPVHVRQEFPSAPINPSAVVHVREGTRTFFFKGKRYWRFTNYTLDRGYPQKLRSPFPEAPRAAINLPDDKGHSSVYIFGTKFFWQWNHETEDVSSGFLFITDYWGGLPPKVDAVVVWSDNFIYFFRLKRYYKIYKRNHDLVPGYPKIKGPAWLRGDCGYEPK
ncbi:stromelysin-2-like [Babylonia areolata]|uniref:stromelysin-2-like n=1 Tax=Babylonia areolata TaxID=304850 RepID=UPI003FD249D4